jgi:uncharacterized protein
VKASDVRYLVDAGPLIGWINQRDQWHAWSVQILRAVDDRLWTAEATLVEACHHLGANTREVSALIGLVQAGGLVVLPVVGTQADRLQALLSKYPMMDVGDASVVILSEQFPLAKVITLDVRHFSVYRRYRNEPLPLIHP